MQNSTTDQAIYIMHSNRFLKNGKIAFRILQAFMFTKPQKRL